MNLQKAKQALNAAIAIIDEKVAANLPVDDPARKAVIFTRQDLEEILDDLEGR